MDEVRDLLAERAASVMALPADRVRPDTRFTEDLHADSLDLVEIVDGVEKALRARGIRIALADTELVALRTVDDAAQRIVAAATAGPADPDAEPGHRQ